MNNTPNNEALIAAITQQVFDLVEPTTRFDRTSLSVIAGNVVITPITAQMRYEVSFSRTNSQGNGALPSGILKVSDSAALDAHIQSMGEAARNELPARLQRWSENQLAPPQEQPLTTSDCFNIISPAGYSYSCSTCGGSGRVTCHTCNGNRRVKCSNCRGSGKCQCGSCYGAGFKNCFPCNGSGQHQTPHSPSASDNPDHIYKMQNFGSCPNCGGSGKLTCSTCGGSKEVQCDKCQASGEILCGTCNGNGQLNCNACGATGTRHAIAQLNCAIDARFSVEAETSVDEVRKRLRSLQDVAAIAALASVSRTSQAPENAVVVNTYAAEIPVTTVDIEVAGTCIEVLGYGSLAQVEDFKNIVGALLEDDLVALESTLRRAPVIVFQANNEIEAALSKVLESEINSRIVAESSRPAVELKVLIQHEFSNAISEEYATRAVLAIKRAMRSLYRGHGLVGTALSICTTIILLAIVHYLLKMNEFPRLLAFSGCLAAGLFAGWSYEWRTLSQLRIRFVAPLGERLVALLKATRSILTWRKIGAGLTLLTTVLALFATGGIWLSAKQRGYNDAKTALQHASEQRVEAAMSAVKSAKPTARHYLLTCLQNPAIKAQVAHHTPQAYGAIIKEPIPTVIKLLHGLKQSPADANRYAQESGMQWALILACQGSKAPTTGFDHDGWNRIFKPLYFEGLPAYRTSYLNLLNTDGEANGTNTEEARQLAELILATLISINH